MVQYKLEVEGYSVDLYKLVEDSVAQYKLEAVDNVVLYMVEDSSVQYMEADDSLDLYIE